VSSDIVSCDNVVNFLSSASKISDSNAKRTRLNELRSLAGNELIRIWWVNSRNLLFRTITMKYSNSNSSMPLAACVFKLQTAVPTGALDCSAYTAEHTTTTAVLSAIVFAPVRSVPNMSHCQTTRSTRYARQGGITKPNPNLTSYN